jgi:Arc/MetJ-type ribon-helix-helix transcriptional regulator
MVEAMDVQVERGDYASKNEVVLDGLRALFKEDARKRK